LIELCNSVRYIAGLRTADACVYPRPASLASIDRCAGVTGLCRVHLFSVWPFDWRPQKLHEKIARNARSLFLRFNAHTISGQWHGDIVCVGRTFEGL